MQRTSTRILGAIKGAETRRMARMPRAVSDRNSVQNLTIGLQPADYQRIDALAKARGVPTSQVGREIIRSYLDAL